MMNRITVSDMAKYEYKINSITGMYRDFSEGFHFSYYRLMDYLDI
jgi:hypothetical protein